MSKPVRRYKKRKATAAPLSEGLKKIIRSSSKRMPAETYGMSTVVTRNPLGLNNKRDVILTYTYVYEDTTASPGLYDNIFCGNGVFQPKYAAATSQPLAFDQYAALYNSYHCKASSIEVQVFNDTGTYNHIIVQPQPYSTAFDSRQKACEQPKAKWKILEESTGLNRQATIKHYATTKEILERNNMGDDTNALVTANPASMWYWHLTARPHNDIAQNIFVVVRIKYYVQFFEPKALPLS